MARRPTARQRRARLLVAGTVLSLLALTVHALAGGDGRDVSLRQLAYLDQVRPIVEASTGQGADLRAVQATAGDLGRPGIRRRLDQVVRDAQGALRAADLLRPPPRLSQAHSLLVATLSLRARGASAAKDGMIAALGPDPTPPTVARLVVTGRDLVAGDQTYAAFRDTVLAAVSHERPDVVVPSQWVPDPDQWAAPELTAFVNILKASSSLAPVVDVATVLVQTTPAAVGKDGAKLLLPKTNTVRVELVVANVGNVAQKQVVVTAALHSSAGDDNVRGFADLLPGQRRALSFRGLRAGPGDATLTVTIGPLPGETSLADNTTTFLLSIHS